MGDTEIQSEVLKRTFGGARVTVLEKGDKGPGSDMEKIEVTSIQINDNEVETKPHRHHKFLVISISQRSWT